MKLLIVGGDSDLGRAIFDKCVVESVSVIRTSRKKGADCFLDMSMPDKVKTQIKEILKIHTDITHCIIASGIADYSIPHRMLINDMQAIFDVNYFSAVTVINALIANFIKNKTGHIQVISSSSAFEPEPMSAHYSASKSAISSYVKSIAQSYGRQNIVAYSICPSFFNSKFIRSLSESRLAAINKSYPSGKMLTIDDVAKISKVLLYSGVAVNGTSVDLSGGMK